MAADADWMSALSALESQLDALEHQLDTDAWDDPMELHALDLHGDVPPVLVPRAQQLAQRLAALERRMTTELAASRDALRELAARRRAARDYHRSETNALGSRAAAD